MTEKEIDELARKVADAAVLWAEWDSKEPDDETWEAFGRWSEQAQPFYDALRAAVREYRARVEAQGKEDNART